MSKFSKVAAILIAASYFPNYPDAQEFHITADEQAFEDLNHATNHARSLGDEANVQTVTREEAENADHIQSQLAADTEANEAADKAAADEAARVFEEEAHKQAAEIEAKAAEEKKAQEEAAKNEN